MNSKTKNIKTNSSIKLQALINIFRVLCFSFASLCFITSFVTARTQSEQLSPTDFLLPYLNQNLHDVNTPIVQKKDAKVRSIPQEKPQTTDTANVDLTAEGNQNLPQMDSAVPSYISTRYGRQLWRAGTIAYQDREDNKSKIELKQLIEQIRSVEFKPKKQPPEPAIIIKPSKTTVEPNETTSVVEVIEETEKKTTESKSPYEPVTNQTLQILVGIAQDPNQVENPFDLGEVLYVSGHLREAAVFYQEALNRIDADKSGAARNRPWILFQLANSLRENDLPAAKKIYVQLITEYHESPWVELAKTREKIIDWFLKDKPQTLITEREL